MGIPGLLIALKSVTYPVHISDYRGLTVGVDAYCWLHRGAFSCGTELCTGVKTDKYVAFCMKRVNLMRQHGVEPIMVFDGASLPLKGGKHLERRRQRDTARRKGEAALAAGEAGAAAQHFSKAVGVTYDMAFALIKELRRSRVELIVAPYEADAQLAYLSRSGLVEAVITEDSDCLPYGCKKVLFKMDNEGHGQEIQLRNLAANTPLTLCNWKNSMFLDLCLLVGCDYMTATIKGLGIATAHGLVQRHRSLDKIIRAVESSKFEVPEGYWEEYKRARLTFRHHIVYDTLTKSTMHLMPLGQSASDMDNLDFLGVHLSADVVQGVVSGGLLPTIHQPYETNHVEPRPSMSPPSTNRSNTTHKGSSYGRAITNTVGIDEPTSKKLIETPSSEKLDIDGACRQADGRRHSGELGRRRASKRPAQPGLTGAFIDKPFDTGRPALAELPFPPEETSLGLTEWSAPAREFSVMWGLQSHQRFDSTIPDYPDGWNSGKGGETSPLSYLEQKHEHFRATRKLSSSAGIHVLHSPGVGMRPVGGIDKDCPGVAAGISSASRNFLDDSLRSESCAETPSVGIDSAVAFRSALSVGGAARSAESLPLSSSGHASGQGASSAAWKGWWGVASPSSGGGNSGRSNWGVNFDVGTPAEAQQVELRPYGRRLSVADRYEGGRHQPDSSSERSAYGLRTPEATSLREGDSMPGDAEDKESNVDGANSVNYGELDLRQGASALALVEPPDVDRAKFVPTSAHHFHTTQVSQRLETLQRRKRRLRQVADAAPALSLPRYRHTHRDTHGIRAGTQHDRSTCDDNEAMTGGSSNHNNQEDSSAEGGDIAWMIQSDTAQKQHRSGGQLSEPGSDGTAVNSRGITSFRKATQRVSASRPSSSHSRTASPSRQENIASPFPRGGGNGERCEDWALTASSRRWTMPPKMHLQSTSGVELPLLRLLNESSGDHSWHSRIDGQQSSSPLTKRTRGTEFWDARLMR